MEIWSHWSNKRVFLSTCSCVNTTVWIHYLYANEMNGEKARWELHKNATCWFKQVLEATPNKIAAVQPLAFHLTKQDERARYNWRRKDELISVVLLWTLTLGLTSVDRPARTFIHQFCMDTRCSLEDILKTMDDINGWRGELRNCLVSGWFDDIYIYIYIYIYIERERENESVIEK